MVKIEELTKQDFENAFNVYKTKKEVIENLGTTKPTLDKYLKAVGFDFKIWKQSQEEIQPHYINPDLIQTVKCVEYKRDSPINELKKYMENILENNPDDFKANLIMKNVFGVGEKNRKTGRMFRIVDDCLNYFVDIVY